MSAVRKCIDSRDLDRFDVLVLRREVETLRNLRSLQTTRNSFTLSTDTSSHPSLPSEEQSVLFASDGEVQASTPTDSGTTSVFNREEKPSVSPVRPLVKPSPSPSPVRPAGRPPSPSPARPTSRPPAPPLAKKYPPAKPKRSSSLNHHRAFESGSSSATEEEWNGKGSKNTDALEHRPTSPFSKAIESHRSSHSGRVKVGNKNHHPPIPNEDFFKDPNQVEDKKVEPVYSSIIKPMKNPASDVLKNRRCSWKNTTPAPETTENNVSASSNLSSSSCESMYSIPHPPQKIILRPASFASSVNDKISRNSQQPVSVDVHRDPM